MIASHYVRPVERMIAASTALRSAASNEAETVTELDEGAPFLLLEDSVGWAWGYAGAERRVGYVPSEALGTA